MRRLLPYLIAPIMASAVFVPSGSAAVEMVDYAPPVDGPVVDDFRPPLQRWGRGNRGVDYAASPGSSVVASAPGTVAFAGPVGGDLHVVVLHPDGLRTSYSFLASVQVRRDEYVEAGTIVGTAAGPVHFGVRDGDRYIDPLAVVEGRLRVQLLPDHPPETGPNQVERSRLARYLRSLPHRLARAPSDLAVEVPEAWRGWLHYGAELATPVSLRTAAAVAAWEAQARRCTPADHVPGLAAGRRVAVLVAGLGSTSRSAAVHDVDTRALGYAPDDVVVFSYAGGTTAERPYIAGDTHTDLRVTGARLGALLASLAARHPGVPVDVLAHSQGGVLARIAALAGGPARTVVTLGSPHQGADLATAAAMVAAVGAIEPPASVLQLAETSVLTRELARGRWPESVRFLSVAARGDLVVPPPQSRLPGADNVTITVGRPYATVHRRLPGAPAATREITLALAGLPPTCQSLADVVTDHLVGTATTLAEDSLGATLTLAASSNLGQ